MSQIPEWREHVGPGWAPILDELHRDVVALDPDYTVEQVKEKFGSLRAYLTYRDPAIAALVQAAQQRSAQTCEECGAPGLIRNRRGAIWLQCLCDTCVQKPAEPW